MNSKIQGSANSQRTEAFAKRMHNCNPSFEPEAFRRLTGSNLVASKVGYGSYRVDQRSDEHARTLRAAIQAGCNLIDTSSNYTDGRSEILIGNVLRELISAEQLERGEIIVVSKVGYMQGQNLDEAVRRESNGQPWEDVIKYMDGCWHCIHPDFLVDQWKRSSDRMGLETIDFYLLHNPEYFFSDAHNRRPQGNLKEIRHIFYDRIFRAFVQMEHFVADGKINYYGISSNTFPSSKSDVEHVSLGRCNKLASDAAEAVHGNRNASHFKIIQLPYNLFEHNALTELNNAVDGQDAAVLNTAQACGLGVLVNRPLNSLRNNQMVRLAGYPHDPHLSYKEAIHAATTTLNTTEKDLRSTLKAWGLHPQLSESIDAPFFYNIAQTLPTFLPQIQNREHWEQVAEGHLIPMIHECMHQTIQGCTKPNQTEWARLQRGYVKEINTLFSLVSGHFNRMASKQIEPIAKALDELLSDEESKLTFSQKALNFVTSSPGVSVVLNGMKRSNYVIDAMAVMRVPAFKQPVRTLINQVKVSSTFCPSPVDPENL